MELFIKLDENFSSDPKIRKLRRILGREAILDYIELLPIFRRFPETGFQIPFDELADIAEHDIFTDPKSLKRTVKECIAIGLFETDENTFWSNRRKKDLIMQADLRSKQQESARRTNEKRRQNNTAGKNKNVSSLVQHNGISHGTSNGIPNAEP